MLLLVAALTAAAPSAFPQSPKSRGEALAALKESRMERRAEAVAWLANHGTMADAPLLHERLRDESALVRGYAEQGLWLLWTRSGDAEIDRLMASATEDMRAGNYDQAIAVLTEVVDAGSGRSRSWTFMASPLSLEWSSSENRVPLFGDHAVTHWARRP